MTKTTDAKPTLSVCLISLNEEVNIARTLDSVKNIASEIVLVDSGSSDKTIEIAKSYGAKVYIEEWKGFSQQKNIALSKCCGDWVLSLDCDEVLTKELEEEIKEALQSGAKDGYFLNRRTFYLGKLLKYAWRPDFKLRLVKRSSNPRWVGDLVHEELKIDGATARLESELIHYSYKDISDHFAKTIKYAQLQALDYYKKGKKFSVAKLIVSSSYSFIKLYILKLGFLDGMQGFFAAESAFFYTMLKYAFLWDFYRKDEEKNS